MKKGSRKTILFFCSYRVLDRFEVLLYWGVYLYPYVRPELIFVLLYWGVYCNKNIPNMLQVNPSINFQ